MVHRWRFRAALLLLAVPTVAVWDSTTVPGPEPLLARVVQVIVGDTIVVTSDQIIKAVRLIGIDTPEVAHHG